MRNNRRLSPTPMWNAGHCPAPTSNQQDPNYMDSFVVLGRAHGPIARVAHDHYGHVRMLPIISHDHGEHGEALIQSCFSGCSPCLRGEKSWSKLMKAIALLFSGFSLLVATASAQSSNVGKRYPSEMRVLVDRVTGFPITALTASPAKDFILYQTHPQWTSDGKYIIFRSNRTGNSKLRHGLSQAFAVDEISGDIIQLTDGPDTITGTGALFVAQKSMHFYYFRGMPDEPHKFIELKLDSLLSDSKAGTMKAPSSYERVITTIPDVMSDVGAFTLDADEKSAYISGLAKDFPGKMDPAHKKKLDPRQEAIWKIDIQSGQISHVIDVPVGIRIHHMQANPFVPGEIEYADGSSNATQRTWLVKADGTGNRPLYKETEGELVRHEVWVDADHMYFEVQKSNILYLREGEKLQSSAARPTGIFSINVRTNEVKILGQLYGEGDEGFEHCDGTSDGKWAVADTYRGNIYLINVRTGEQTLLTTGHKMKPDHTHPTFSPDNKRIVIQSGLLSDGKTLNIMTITIPPELQKR